MAAAVAVVSSALFAQDSITVDLSQMKGTSVAMVAEPITNKLVLYPMDAAWLCVTNALVRSSTYADGVNDALDAVKRITAGLPDGTNLTLEAVCELVYEELHIERRIVAFANATAHVRAVASNVQQIVGKQNGGTDHECE